jgi:hypothetical protein
MDPEPDLNDYAVLITDGSANQPMDIDNSGIENDLFLDVNDNGIRDSGDDLTVEYPGGDNNVDVTITDGLVVVGSAAGRRQLLNTDEASEGSLSDGDLSNNDDYDFVPEFLAQHPGVTPNFRIIDGTLFVDANGDNVFTQGTVNTFTAGHTDEITVKRNGAMRETVDFSGDGVDAWSLYWATQTKAAGTFMFTIGYDLGAADPTLLQSMASSGGYFPGNLSDISDIFDEIAHAHEPLADQHRRRRNVQRHCDQRRSRRPAERRRHRYLRSDETVIRQRRAGADGHYACRHAYVEQPHPCLARRRPAGMGGRHVAHDHVDVHRDRRRAEH